MTLDLDPSSREVDPAAPVADAPRAPGWAGPLAGFIAAAAAVATGSLIAAVLDVVHPLDALGSEFIDHTPAWLKELAIELFGTSDKQALRVGMYLTIAALAALVGALARRRTTLALAVVLLTGLAGAAIASGRPGQDWTAAIPMVVAALVGVLTLRWLTGIVRRGDGASEIPALHRPRSGWDRRAFVRAAGGVTAGAAAVAVAARRIDARRVGDVVAKAPTELPPPTGITVPSDATGTPLAPTGATLSPATPYFTPNDDFYLIDTALSVPRVDVDRWALEIVGRVERPLRLTYADLLAREQVERIITLCCVSNEVGGDLIGNAVWQGVLLAPLLAEAGITDDAEQVFTTSVDGWTCGFPVEAATDGRDAMIAVGMNGEPLPRQHGFPARLVVPGLYGYVSATKWLQRIELNRWDDAEGYWVPRGWAREAPVKTQSRIDVPRRGEVVPAGRVVIAGVAWAQQRGISRVEVKIDGEPWRDAELATDVTVDSWRQWRLAWDASPGDYLLRVRATDGNGELQTEEISRPDPDGATGWHTRRITVA